MLAAGMQPGPAQLDFVAISGRRFSRVRVAQGPMVEGSGAVIAAGTHSDPANAVSVWNASVAGDPRHADRLLDHEEEIHDNYDGGPCARPALSYRVDGDVAALEFWGAGHVREDGSLRLWAGTSAGSVSLLSAQRYEHETDAEGRRLEAWQVSLVGTAEHTAKVPLHSLAASALAVLPSGVDVLSAGEDGKVWSLACTGPAVVPTLVGRADSVAIYDIKFADVTGESYITAGAGGGLKRWSRRGGEPVTIAPASACAWTALEMVNDVYLLAGDANGIVALFDLRMTQEAVAEGRGHEGQACHGGAVTALRRACDDHFLSSAQDGTVVRFQVRQGGGESIQQVEQFVSCQAVNDVSAGYMYRGMRHQARLVVAARDTGLLISGLAV
eukprot:Tamp_14207.p1 GENE.Tamp_14207~~Tamp_14207.p1  ORF type:complete len:385 (+),score=80.09 Tamp_14207:44-1198(+)